MRNRLQHTHILTALLVLVIIVLSAILGGAWYLIDYALKPGDRSRNEQLAWAEMDSLYPGMAAWRDSLQAVHALRDTFIIAKDGARVHAWYVRAARQTAATALLVHGYTDCSIRMMPLGRMYNRNLQMNIIVPDLRNAGRSDGDHFQMGWFDRYDVRQWAEVAPALFGDSVRLVVHGVSMGAATTMMLSGDSDLPVSIKAFVEAVWQGIKGTLRFASLAVNTCSFAAVPMALWLEFLRSLSPQSSAPLHQTHVVYSWHGRQVRAHTHGLSVVPS